MIVILVRLLQKVLGDLCGECNMGRRLISATPWGFSHALKIVDAVLRGIAQVLDNRFPPEEQIYPKSKSREEIKFEHLSN